MPFGQIPPFYTNGGAFGVTGSPTSGWTFTKTAEASAAETIVTFKISDDATAAAYIGNSSTTNSRLSPVFGGVGASSASTVTFQAENSNDSGTTPIGIFNARKNTPAALTVRPLWSWQNNGTQVMVLSAAGALVVAGGTAPSIGVGAATWRSGTGDPNSVVTGNVGDLWTRTDGGAATCLYVKESGAATNTGWVAK